jgi:hypothetical protein
MSKLERISKSPSKVKPFAKVFSASAILPTAFNASPILILENISYNILHVPFLR